MAEDDTCIQCQQTVRPKQEGLQCDDCTRWQHRKCNTGITRKAYWSAVKSRKDIDWKCKPCSQVEHPALPRPRPLAAPRTPRTPRVPRPIACHSPAMSLLRAVPTPSRTPVPAAKRPCSPQLPKEERRTPIPAPRNTKLHPLSALRVASRTTRSPRAPRPVPAPRASKLNKTPITLVVDVQSMLDTPSPGYPDTPVLSGYPDTPAASAVEQDNHAAPLVKIEKPHPIPGIQAAPSATHSLHVPHQKFRPVPAPRISRIRQTATPVLLVTSFSSPLPEYPDTPVAVLPVTSRKNSRRPKLRLRLPAMQRALINTLKAQVGHRKLAFPEPALHEDSRIPEDFLRKEV